jgi:hypothetical protein
MKSKAEKLHNFVHAFGAARVLLQKANEEGALLEGMALYAAMTDGFLRIGLVLKRQMVKNTMDIEDVLISQEKNGSFYAERKILRMARNEAIITQEIFDELTELYDGRNDAIHKFFLTDIQYADLPPLLERYEVMYETLKQIVYDLEEEQISKGVGMSGSSRVTKDDTLAMLRNITMKIDSKAGGEVVPAKSEPISTHSEEECK